MIRYVIKRILLMVPIMIGVSFIVFTILNIVPGDPARAMLGEGALQEDVDALNHELGLDRPFFVRYFTFLKDVFTRFDFRRFLQDRAAGFERRHGPYPGQCDAGHSGDHFVGAHRYPAGHFVGSQAVLHV